MPNLERIMADHHLASLEDARIFIADLLNRRNAEEVAEDLGVPRSSLSYLCLKLGIKLKWVVDR